MTKNPLDAGVLSIRPSHKKCEFSRIGYCCAYHGACLRGYLLRGRAEHGGGEDLFAKRAAAVMRWMATKEGPRLRVIERNYSGRQRRLSAAPFSRGSAKAGGGAMSGSGFFEEGFQAVAAAGMTQFP